MTPMERKKADAERRLKGKNEGKKKRRLGSRSVGGNK